MNIQHLLGVCFFSFANVPVCGKIEKLVSKPFYFLNFSTLLSKFTLFYSLNNCTKLKAPIHRVCGHVHAPLTAHLAISF